MTLSSSQWIITTMNLLKIACITPAVLASYPSYFLYEPDTQVADFAFIDLDQEAIEMALLISSIFGAEDHVSHAGAIYNEGGHSQSFAVLTLVNPLPISVTKGTPIEGLNEMDGVVLGEAYSDYPAGSTEIRVLYTPSNVYEKSESCFVGALTTLGTAVEITQGCFAESGQIQVSSISIDYIYDLFQDNQNGQTIAGFSTMASFEMGQYENYLLHVDYYGVQDWAHQWVQAALNGIDTNFLRGNAAFSSATLIGRGEAIKRGTLFLNIFMHVIGMLEGALDKCMVDAQSDAVNSWDSAVALYSGSMADSRRIEQTKGGNMLFRLANNRCKSMKTCGAEGNDSEGIAKVNYDIFDGFLRGKEFIRQGDCASAMLVKEDIERLMYIPMIQGTLRYTYIVGEQAGSEKTKVEAATYAAAILPRIHNCNAESAKIIYSNLYVGAGSTSFSAVKLALESSAQCLGVTCDDVGGLWDESEGDYFPNAGPCGASDESDNNEVEVDKECVVPKKFIKRYKEVLANNDEQLKTYTSQRCSNRPSPKKCKSRLTQKCKTRGEDSKQRIARKISLNSNCSIEAAKKHLQDKFDIGCQIY